MKISTDCPKCKKKFERSYALLSWSSLDLCFECQKKEDAKKLAIQIFFMALVLAVIIGLRFAWAKIIYKDARCFWAECRIIK